MALTDVQIRNAKPGPKTYKLADSNGLFLQVTATGSKLWRMKFRHNGKEGLLSFGPYPLITLAEAREKRDSARRQMRDGLNPSLEKSDRRSQPRRLRLLRSRLSQRKSSLSVSGKRLIPDLGDAEAPAELPLVPLEVIANGHEFPPPPFLYRVRDGFHRFYASIAAGFSHLPAEHL